MQHKKKTKWQQTVNYLENRWLFVIIRIIVISATGVAAIYAGWLVIVGLSPESNQESNHELKYIISGKQFLFSKTFTFDAEMPTSILIDGYACFNDNCDIREKLDLRLFESMSRNCWSNWHLENMESRHQLFDRCFKRTSNPFPIVQCNESPCWPLLDILIGFEVYKNAADYRFYFYPSGKRYASVYYTIHELKCNYDICIDSSSDYLKFGSIDLDKRNLQIKNFRVKRFKIGESKFLRITGEVCSPFNYTNDFFSPYPDSVETATIVPSIKIVINDDEGKEIILSKQKFKLKPSQCNRWSDVVWEADFGSTYDVVVVAEALYIDKKYQVTEKKNNIKILSN